MDANKNGQRTMYLIELCNSFAKCISPLFYTSLLSHEPRCTQSSSCNHTHTHSSMDNPSNLHHQKNKLHPNILQRRTGTPHPLQHCHHPTLHQLCPNPLPRHIPTQNKGYPRFLRVGSVLSQSHTHHDGEWRGVYVFVHQEFMACLGVFDSVYFGFGKFWRVFLFAFHSLDLNVS